MGSQKPLMLYGTAWKGKQTADLTHKALQNGFTAIDTANYPTAYEEGLTGDAIALSLASGLQRDDFYIQTKFTPVWAHEKGKVPFNEHQSIEGQIKESVQQSLDHLQVDYLDSLVLHAPYDNEADTIAAWRALEMYVPSTARTLGVSNFNASQLQELYANAVVKPVVVQNRFYKETGFDFGVRSICAEHGITYQAFYMLKHNPEVMESDVLEEVAQTLGLTKELTFYVLILGLGEMQVLNGTTNPETMLQDTRTIDSIFQNEASLRDLQPHVEKFRKLLQHLASAQEQQF